ncbi:Concanavalin A-like lectin/glucanases superfamily protein [Penicillium ucsense]|uniref:Concanavalin A-like lectin/glucanases superfamily protein n=1 Tax=Penicillium ucsense TaxID=2839758 RepID=A0A8J8W4S2_9EURO|nr:Concanavalin A-like lectin/glucanases superfamily protein [Penicillium ucsense]KAF7736473.1 Concanavalin A-like lectin/glucanases superfamily protein [Penicillium ucsense]
MSPPPLLSASSSASIDCHAEDLAPIVDQLRSLTTAENPQVPDLAAAIEPLLRLRHTFIDDARPRVAKDAFRQMAGFQTILELTNQLAEIYDPDGMSDDERKGVLAIYKDALGTLAEALKTHLGNKRYFARKIAGGGMAALERSLATLTRKVGKFESDAQQLYGAILAAALCQETAATTFTAMSAKFGGKESVLSPQEVRSAVDQFMGSAETVEVPELLGSLVRVWAAESASTGSESEIMRLTFAACLGQLAAQSRRNVVALHATGMLTAILSILFRQGYSETERKLYQDLAHHLSVQGINTLDDAVALYRHAHDDYRNLEFLLSALKYSKEPPSIQFDLSLHGFCSVEFATLGRPFPPTSSAGYTLAAWVRFDEFDRNTHTTIFGTFDASQTCFVLAYIEKDTRKFIFQTSIRGSRPSVRFKSATFETNRWYHICIVHRRAKPAHSSRASLFVDGEFMEQLKIDYPTTPVSNNPHRPPRIQAFFGTPQDLAMRLGKGVSNSRWSLSNGLLLDEAYSDDLVAVFYNLGPRYFGNFQDCLGSFQTYKASATLNLRNEHLHPGREEESDIVTAIRRRASSLVPETTVVINLSPVAVLDSNDGGNVDESRLSKCLSKQAAKSLQHMTKAGGNALAVNGGTPAINDGLTLPQGVGVLTGEPVVAVPWSMDDASWCIGGCAAVHLSLVRAADSAQATRLAVEALYEAVQDNWRNSEAMERENGYGILAVLLREKLGFQIANPSSIGPSSTISVPAEEHNDLMLDLLRLTLRFVGYDFEHPDHSIIANPLAYRVLLVDMDIWRSGEGDVPDLYYSQFRTFVSDSNYRRFNAKRFGRMRVSKKLLETLKSNELADESIRPCLGSFQAFMESSLSPDLLRSLALSITFNLHRPRTPSALHKKRSLRFAGPSSPRPSSSSISPPTKVSGTTLAIEMLRLYASVLCNALDLNPLKRFAKAVTNKWLLYLSCEDEPEVVVLAVKILARLLIVHGSSYSKKFSDKNGGYTVLEKNLGKWWNVPVLWPICFSILFGQDLAAVDLDRPFTAADFLSVFLEEGDLRIAFPEMLPVIMNMLKHAVESLVSLDEPTGQDPVSSDVSKKILMSAQKSKITSASEVLVEGTCIVHSIVAFLEGLSKESRNFRDFTIQSGYVQEILGLLWPAVVGVQPTNASFELHSRHGDLNLEESSFLTRPKSSRKNSSTPLQVSIIDSAENPDESADSLQRRSSFILVSSDKFKNQPLFARIQRAVSVSRPAEEYSRIHLLVKSIASLVLDVFEEQLLQRKDFSGLGLYHKTPAGNLDNQADFNSWLLSLFLSRLEGIPSIRPHLLHEARALTNIARFATHLTEAVYEGWFLNGGAVVLEFLGVILEYIQRPDVSHIKTIRLCSQSVATLHTMLYRITLFQLSEAHDSETLSVLQRLSYWQVVLLAAAETQPRNLQLLCFLLYTRLISADNQIRLAAASLWRMILVQKPQDMSNLLRHGSAPLQRRLTDVFEALAGLDDEKFLREIDDERQDLDAFFLGVLSHQWETFVADENVKNEESARHRISKRKEKLKQWAQLEKYDEDVLRKHDATLPHWISNISASEFLKSQRFLQDLQDNSVFMWSAFSNLLLGLKRPGALFAEDKERNYKLDQTEGRSRMRLRVVPDESGERQDYQPKRKASEPPAPKLDLRLRALSAGEMASSPKGTIAKITTGEPRQQDDPSEETDDRSTIEDEKFEMVDDPKLELEDYEDRNRRVMRSLHRGDQVQSVCNMSRIIGLEAVEGLLILGKDCIYILDNFFQRADGEIVNVWQAPPDERDPYVRMIAGRESNDRRSHEHETRSWKWADLVSVSKRRFLFRDVALEIFFTDGTSYLLTFFAAHVRDNLCTQLGNKAPQVTGSAGHSRPEDIWRFETLRSQEDAPQSLGSKFASVFGHLPANPATRKWVRGEISNFHYLMLINTLAGRTFNDLTQYPVFPWVLADYTSEELDLTNPKTFRDLSKPMGCQTPDREMGFRERFNAFAEMGDDNSPPFHYGTHYSSAMIVTSYLIRLQPFVKSYLLLQGGTFDHADRLFYSIRKTWESASRGNMTDVRELIPEFFYLPEFLINSNKYEFGMLQNMRTAIDSVELPPWAKGDPKIFIQKHREALESPYVSENLHHWIDLVFGCKQKGEAAIEAVNVFHHLSYKGAKDLDAISDPMERLATIGIIHNFGQTPGQIFHRAHPPREGQKYRVPRLDALAESLTQMPLSLLDIGEHVTTLAMKQDRLLCTSALRINVPPAYDQYLEWGFFDGSVRFYSAEGRKLLGHFEHLHIGQLSYVTFADSRTLVTCGNDCTVSLWTVTATSRAVDLQPIGSLFGHRTPVTVLAVSRSFSTLLSASSDGQIMLWDLNRRGFVRTLPGDGVVDCAKVNDVTGDIVVCRGRRLTMYTLNGEVVIDQPVCDAPDDRVLSCSFYEGVQNEWLERELVLTGHARGVVNIWSKVIRQGIFELELIRQLHHTDSSRDNGANIQAGISCILALPQVVYTGDEAGRVYEWNCIQRR